LLLARLVAAQPVMFLVVMVRQALRANQVRRDLQAKMASPGLLEQLALLVQMA
jgi:hypothetical protein